MTQPKILIGCPTSEHKAYCFQEYLEGIKALTYPNFDVLLVDNSQDNNYFNKISKLLPTIKGPFIENARPRIAESRNLLRQKFLEGDYDYFLSLEQDVVPPKDVIERLLAHNKKVISGVYYKKIDFGKGEKISPLVYKMDVNLNITNFTAKELEQPRLIQVGAFGVGCVLIHRDILKNIKFRIFEEGTSFDDMPFCLDCKNNNFDLFVDTSIKCIHHTEKMDWATIKK